MSEPRFPELEGIEIFGIKRPQAGIEIIMLLNGEEASDQGRLGPIEEAGGKTIMLHQKQPANRVIVSRHCGVPWYGLLSKLSRSEPFHLMRRSIAVDLGD
jgi:hypothetical protein